VVTMDYAADKADIFVTATALPRDHPRPHGEDEDQAIVCNMATSTTR